MIKQIAIALYDSPGGIEEGDIIVCRTPIDGIGVKEAGMWLWITAIISEQLAQVLCLPRRGLITNQVISKRRYQIPLDKIKELDAEFILALARDMTENYQPYLYVDDNFLFVDSDPTTFELENLEIIWDKLEGKFI